MVGEDSSSWLWVNEKDLWECESANEDDYVLVVQEDIVDGIACFMAAYLASLKETKVYGTFSVSFLRKGCQKKFIIL